MKLTLHRVLLVVAILYGTGTRLSHHLDVTSRSPDERTYTEYAARVADHGLSILPAIAHDYINSPGWLEHPGPTRTGYVIITAGAMRLLGTRDASAGAFVSLAASIGMLFLTATFCLRFFNPWIATSAVALLSSHVTSLGMSRRAWTDELAAFLSLLIIYITCEIIRYPRRRYIVSFLLTCCVSVLVKESTVLTVAISGVILSLVLYHRSIRKHFYFTLTGLVCLPVVILSSWFAFFGRATLQLIPHPGHWLTAAPTGWVLTAYVGPWYQFFLALWWIGPLTLFAATAAIILSRPWRLLYAMSAGRLMSLITILYLSIAAFSPAMQYFRLTSPADAIYCILAAIGIFEILSRAHHYLDIADYSATRIIIISSLVAEVIHNNTTFINVVVRTGMEDLPARWILIALGKL